MADRVEVLKTYKLFIGGQFPRTESGRFYKAFSKKGDLMANACLASRKDFRNAVVAARKAQPSWSGRSAYNIGQILYRMAEHLEGAKLQFSDLIAQEQGLSANQSQLQVEKAIDRIIYFAGWSDKYQQLFSSVNPVASSHFNFSRIEPTGVVACIGNSDMPFLAFVSLIVSAIVSGNTLVILAGEKHACSAMTFAEVLNNSDLPGGVVNILTGRKEELDEHAAKHMDVNALLLIGDSDNQDQLMKFGAENVKRVRCYSTQELMADQFENPYVIQDLTEIKTTWHPIEQIGGSSPGY